MKVLIVVLVVHRLGEHSSNCVVNALNAAVPKMATGTCCGEIEEAEKIKDCVGEFRKYWRPLWDRKF